jgi:hypothetical protein
MNEYVLTDAPEAIYWTASRDARDQPMRGLR